MFVLEFLAKSKIVIMPKLPYSEDLAPVDFFLFTKLMTPMKGKRFATIEVIKEKSKQELLTKIAFQEWFEEWRAARISVLYLKGFRLNGTSY